MSGEATRVSGEERKGVASAYGPGGSYMSQMNTPSDVDCCFHSDQAKDVS